MTMTSETSTSFENLTGNEWMSTTPMNVTLIPPSSTPDVVAYIHRFVAGVVCCIIALIGLPGNGLVITSVIVAKKLRTTTNILIVSLAVADFLTCAILPLHAVGLIDRAHEYPLSEFICGQAAGVQYICVSVSISTLSAIAFVRWYVITRSIRGSSGLNTPRRLAVVVVIIWIVSIALVAVPVLLGMGELGYSIYYALCSTTDTSLPWFSLIQGGFILVNIILTGIFYTLILSFVLRHNRKYQERYESKMSSITSESSQGKKSTRGVSSSNLRMKREIDMTKNLFLIVCIFVICWLPNVFTFSTPGMSVATVYGALIAMANSAVNPIVYGLRYPNFREVFKRILLCRSVNALYIRNSSNSL